MNSAIDNLMSLGDIVKCSPSEGQLSSTIFLTDKKNGKKRFILNVKKLNVILETSHCKMEDYRTVRKLIEKGVFMTSVDLKDA